MLRRHAALTGLLVAWATAAQAQVTTGVRVTNVAANAAIGGVIAGVRSVFHGRRTVKAVLVGAAGGIVQSVGRQVAARGTDGSGLLGREISAVGISLTYSAGIDSVVGMFPLGPVLLEVRPHDARRVRLRVNAVDMATIAVALADGRSDFDLGASLSIGAPVFEHALSALSPQLARGGYTQVGTVFVAPATEGIRRPLVLQHEAVHVLQWDAITLLLASPVERALLSRIPGVRRAVPFVDAGLLGPAVVYLVARSVDYDHHPWEREAYRLTTGQPTYRP